MPGVLSRWLIRSRSPVSNGAVAERLQAWNGAENAEKYADFCRRFPLYRQTSEDLCDAAGLDQARVVVDLACGTGETARVLLSRLGQDARVVAVDASEAMVSVGRREVADGRVTWMSGPAERIDDLVDAPVDAVVCNSAIWQMDMPRVFGGVRRILRPEGRFAFNVGWQFIKLPLPPKTGTGERRPSLGELLHAEAVLHHGFAPRVPRREPLTVDGVLRMLEDAGLSASPPHVVDHEMTPEATRAWLSIPIFTWQYEPVLSYEQRMAALGRAWERVDRTQTAPSRSAVFVAAPH